MPKTILLVEDDPDARAIYSEALANRGHRVLTAVHGAEGVHLARKHRPDLILMDIRMPLMDGWAAIEYVRSDPETAKIPIWAISAYPSEEEARDQPARTRFDRFIAKPIPPAELVTEVEARIDTPQEPSPPA